MKAPGSKKAAKRDEEADPSLGEVLDFMRVLWALHHAMQSTSKRMSRSIDRDLILYLFGTPGQTRFWFMWDELVRGTIGAVVMVDTRRLADCFAAIDFFEHRRLPYLVAINCFDGMQYHNAQDVRDALAISSDVPVVSCDARNRESTKNVLISLVEYVLTMRRTRAVAPA